MEYSFPAPTAISFKLGHQALVEMISNATMGRSITLFETNDPVCGRSAPAFQNRL
jgi:hypothetical protein